MISPKIITLAALLALGGAAPLAFADEPSVNLDRPGSGMEQIKKGDKVPDSYKRKELAFGDWKQHHLTAPTENEQWVEIQDKYVLVNVPNGTVKDMVAKDAKPKQ